ncbi:hypothetical protein AB0N14_38915 [Streptomyces sp. NPDC051104]|uniref:hypothetical protein n=1 Tax=Streptomyces sp. NPDC051104 TaxID=3155044 RepID=UPI0034420D52
MEQVEQVPWPEPAPFMEQCTECADLLERFLVRIILDVGCHSEALLFSRHIAESHPEDLPGPHTDGCSTCQRYAERDEKDLWAVHRARGLFLPAPIARLM